MPSGVKNLADIVAYNLAHAEEELVEPYWTDQSGSAKSTVELFYRQMLLT